MKPEWGTKHKCPSCSTHFYDMCKTQAVCPKCATPANDKAALLAKINVLNKDPKPIIDNEVDPLDDIEVIDDDEDAPDDFIEDTDDLGDTDESDMSEIFEHIDHDTQD